MLEYKNQYVWLHLHDYCEIDVLFLSQQVFLVVMDVVCCFVVFVVVAQTQDFFLQFSFSSFLIQGVRVVHRCPSSFWESMQHHCHHHYHHSRIKHIGLASKTIQLHVSVHLVILN